MTQEFNPKKTEPLETVYVSADAKEWIKTQALSHDVSMVAIVDEMVKVCTQFTGYKRPNILTPKDEK